MLTKLAGKLVVGCCALGDETFATPGVAIAAGFGVFTGTAPTGVPAVVAEAAVPAATEPAGAAGTAGRPGTPKAASDGAVLGVLCDDGKELGGACVGR